MTKRVSEVERNRLLGYFVKETPAIDSLVFKSRNPRLGMSLVVLTDNFIRYRGTLPRRYAVDAIRTLTKFFKHNVQILDETMVVVPTETVNPDFLIKRRDILEISTEDLLTIIMLVLEFGFYGGYARHQFGQISHLWKDRDSLFKEISKREELLKKAKVKFTVKQLVRNAFQFYFFNNKCTFDQFHNDYRVWKHRREGV